MRKTPLAATGAQAEFTYPIEVKSNPFPTPCSALIKKTGMTPYSVIKGNTKVAMPLMNPYIKNVNLKVH